MDPYAYLDYPGDNGLIQKAWMVGEDGLLMAGGKPCDPRRYFPFLPGVYRIPLLVHMPGQKKERRVFQIVQPWDMTATMLDAFGLESSPEALGTSLLPLVRGRSRKGREVAVFGSDTVAQATDGRWLYATWRGLRRPALFDLKADTAIRKNVLRGNAPVATRLHGEIVQFMKRQDLDDAVIESFAI